MERVCPHRKSAQTTYGLDYKFFCSCVDAGHGLPPKLVLGEARLTEGAHRRKPRETVCGSSLARFFSSTEVKQNCILLFQPYPVCLYYDLKLTKDKQERSKNKERKDKGSFPLFF